MKIINRTKKRELRAATFFCALLTATLMFLPSIISGGGYFIFFGDFNVQQIPFYKMCHEAVKHGNFAWSSTTDLGTGFVGAYSFYLLGSPFFWLTIPFPTDFVPYLMAPLLILKISLAALTAYLYIRRFTKNPEPAMLGGLLYAFSGFSVYNIFFNHFHEALIVFPLVLLGLEMLVGENRRGVLCFTVFLAATVNYFFFFGMVVFTVIYYLIKLCSHCWKFKFDIFMSLIFECVLGLAMSAALLLPSALSVLGNSRLSEILHGWGAIFYGKEQIYGNIIECFFFPPDLPARPVFFPGADVKWSSLGGWLPLMGMVGVFTWMQEKKGHWLRRVIGTMIFMALVPILNSAFYMFNTAYYARWFYMPILMMCLSTAMSIEDREVNWWSAYRWCLAITLGISLVVGLFPSEDSSGKLRLGLYTESEDGLYFYRFLVTAGIALLCLAVLAALIPLIKKRARTFCRAAIPLVCVISVLYGAFFITSGKQHSYSDEVMIDSLIEGSVDLEGDGGFRVDTYDCVDNTAMFLGLRSINCFHSVVSPSIIDFYDFLGIERSVASRPETSYYAIRPLLSVKYVLNLEGENDFETENGTRMKGYRYVGSQSGHRIYENLNYVPMGFTYDYYMTEDQCGYFGSEHRSEMMLKALMLNKSQINKYKGILKNIAEDYDLGNVSSDSEKTEIKFDYETYAEDCAKLSENACSDFRYTNSGFEAEITLKKDNLVFFSVPYDEGFSATVNGKAVQIEKVDKGFMAVACEKGENKIVFTYKTRGLALGLKISAAAFVLFAIYLSVTAVIRKNHPEKFFIPCPETELLREKFERYQIADTLSETPEKDEPDNKNPPPTDDEEDAFFNKIDISDADGCYSGIEGGFTVDETVLDDELPSGEKDGDGKE